MVQVHKANVRRKRILLNAAVGVPVPEHIPVMVVLVCIAETVGGTTYEEDLALLRCHT